MKKFRTRIKIIFSFIFVFFFIIFYKLISIQIIDHVESPLIETTLEPKRGKILDRNFQELAIMINADSLYSTKGIYNPKTSAGQLSKILGTKYSTIYKKLTAGRDFMWISRKITYGQSKAIAKLNNPYLGFIKEYKRIYPNKELAANIIGFTGTDNNGLEGIEYAYDTILSGKPGILLTQKDARGRVIISKNRGVIPVINGSDIVLTIDKVIQHIAEQELREAFKEYGSGGGSAIVMDPYTGEVLAMVNVPSYDPNEFKKYFKDNKRNRALIDTIEPGSTMKIFTAAAGIEEGVITRQETLNCEKNSLVVGGHRVKDSHEHLKLTFQEIIEKSSNIGVVRVALRLGKERIFDYFSKLGFGKKTGIDLPGESEGKLISPRKWSGTSISAIPIGQEIGVTAIQLARAISIIANGGHEIKPYIIKEIRSPEGKIKRLSKPQIGNKIISDNTIKEMHTILESVVEAGTGKRSKTEDYTIAAKTGTAQKFVRGKGGYASGETVVTFVGYAPVTKPKICIVLVLESRESSGWAEGILGPVFKNVAQRSLHYLNVFPDKNIINNKPVPEIISVSDEVAQKANELRDNYKNKVMPSVLGMSIRKTINILNAFEMEVKVIGNGVAIKQVPSPGIGVDKGTTCIIYFAKR